MARYRITITNAETGDVLDAETYSEHDILNLETSRTARDALADIVVSAVRDAESLAVSSTD